MLANHITGLKKMIFLKKSVGPGMPPITLGLKIRMSPNWWDGFLNFITEVFQMEKTEGNAPRISQKNMKIVDLLEWLNKIPFDYYLAETNIYASCKLELKYLRFRPRPNHHGQLFS